MIAALERGEWSAARPGRTLPPGKEPVPILQEAIIIVILVTKISCESMGKIHIVDGKVDYGSFVKQQ